MMWLFSGPALALAAALVGPPVAWMPAPDPGLDEARRIEALIDAGDLKTASTRLEAGTKAGSGPSLLGPLAQATLRGRLALARDQPSRAATQFARAIELAPEHAPLRLLHAHALLRAARYAEVEATLKHRALRDHRAAVALLRATAKVGLEDAPAAYTILAAAADATDDVELRRQLVLLCAREGLLETAATWAESMSPPQLGRELAIAVLQEIRGGRHALPLARRLAHAFADDGDVQAQLGWVASAAGLPSEASRAFARAVRLGTDEAYAAAEHARAQGRHRDALRMNMRVADPRRRAEQRFDIVFESGALARAIVLAAGLEREYGLSSRRRYNLAYAHYALQQYAEASTQARELAESDQAARARSLLRAMGR